MNGGGSDTRSRFQPTSVERRTFRFGDAADRTLAMEHWYWTALDQIAEHEGMTTNELVREIDRRRGSRAPVPALRLFCVSYFQQAVTGRGDIEGALDEAIGPGVASDDDEEIIR